MKTMCRQVSTGLRTSQRRLQQLCPRARVITDPKELAKLNAAAAKIRRNETIYSRIAE